MGCKAHLLPCHQAISFWQIKRPLHPTRRQVRHPHNAEDVVVGNLNVTLF